jgi:hypothetical protein
MGCVTISPSMMMLLSIYEDYVDSITSNQSNLPKREARRAILSVYFIQFAPGKTILRVRQSNFCISLATSFASSSATYRIRFPCCKLILSMPIQERHFRMEYQKIDGPHLCRRAAFSLSNLVRTIVKLFVL